FLCPARPRAAAPAPAPLGEGPGVRIPPQIPRASPSPQPSPKGEGVGSGTRSPSPQPSPKRGGRPLWGTAFPLLGFALLTGPVLVLMALGAMLPTIDFDALEYHLQGPKEYFQVGRIAFLPHNVYTSMPFGVEMLHLLGMVVFDDWWWGALAGQLLVMLFAPAAAALIALTARRWGSPRAAWVAAVVYLTTPWIYRLAVIPYVEGPLCYFHAALVWAAGRAWVEEQRAIRTRLWGLVGALAGGAMACKYPALVSAVIPFGLLALIDATRQRRPAIALVCAAGVAVVIGPWLLKNLIDTGNPVYPLAYRIFDGWYWNPTLDAKWQAAHGPRPVSLAALIESLIDVAGRSDWQSPLYAALAPLALLRPGSRRFALALWGYALYLFTTWWLLTHRLDRFWLPLLPALAVLAGLGAAWTSSRDWSLLLGLILAVAIATNLVYISTALAGYNEWTTDLTTARRAIPALLNAPLARLDAELPPDAKVLLVGQASVFYMQHPIVYNTVFNEETIETLTRGRAPEQVRAELLRRGVTHVYVDWYEINRYRRPGNYGFTPYVTPALFARLVAAGVLEPLPPPGPSRDLYRVRGQRVATPRNRLPAEGLSAPRTDLF
ncbi:MAG: glycosyltransferase family 39 protein, partial [Isosphaeraceae bacterium]|nr:glycosyltransferase family 39 protein [Isosphaeraceae bacterium]